MKPASFKNPFFIGIIILTSYMIGLWNMSIPLTGDQKTYLSIALEMFEKKTWIIPTLFNEPNFLKPPFQYWMTIVGWNVFGLNLFGALIPSVLALVFSAIFCFKLSEKLELRRPEIAALLFTGTLGSMTYGSTAQMEIWIVLFYLASWFFALNSRLVIAFVLVGMMAWVKGPLYPVIWTIGLMLWRPTLLKSTKFWCAIFIGVLIGLSWYLLAARTNQEEILNQFFLTENVGKITTQQGSIQSLWTEFFLSLLPWGVILVFGLFQKENRASWKKNIRFYLAYGLIPLLFFTFFPYRVNSYLYILTPIMAMLTAEIDLSNLKKSKLVIYGFYISLFIFLVTLGFVLWKNEWIGFEVLISLITAVICFVIGLYQAQWRWVAFASLLVVSLIRVSAVQIGEKDFAGLRTDLVSRKNDYAFVIDSRDIWHEYGLISSGMGQSVYRLYDQNSIDRFLAHGGSLIVQEDQDLKLPSSIHCNVWPRLKRRTRFPFETLFKNGLRFGDPEITRNYQICTASQQH